MVAYDLQMIKPPVTDWTADTASEVSSVDTQPAVTERQRRPQRRHNRTRSSVEDAELRNVRRGRRGTLRQQNENLLRQLKEVHEVEVEDEDYVPGYSNRETALSTLMNDGMRLEEWYSNSMHEFYEDEESTEVKENIEHLDETDVKDYRTSHPAALSPYAAYCRISWRLRRGLLRRRHLPTEEMKSIEGTLREYFGWCPEESNDRLWSEMSPPLRRLITHAVAEYLGLHSRSEELSSEMLRKKVCVSIRQPPFSPPLQHLADYLSERSNPVPENQIRT